MAWTTYGEWANKVATQYGDRVFQQGSAYVTIAGDKVWGLSAVGAVTLNAPAFAVQAVPLIPTVACSVSVSAAVAAVSLSFVQSDVAVSTFVQLVFAGVTVHAVTPTVTAGNAVLLYAAACLARCNTSAPVVSLGAGVQCISVICAAAFGAPVIVAGTAVTAGVPVVQLGAVAVAPGVSACVTVGKLVEYLTGIVRKRIRAFAYRRDVGRFVSVRRQGEIIRKRPRIFVHFR